MSLTLLLFKRVAAGLDRAGIADCAEWAEKYRVMGGQSFPGPWSFAPYPWSRQLHNDNSDFVVCRKSAQMGFTEAALNKTLYTIDYRNSSVLYMLPASEPDAKDFSEARFDAALDLSPHLRNLFSETDNIKHKRAGTASLYIRGSRSRSQAKSVPASLLVGDEVDEMVIANLKLAFERLSGQLEKQIFLLSTPTISQYGIDEFYQLSTKCHFIFKCPCCSKSTELIFPDCLVITADQSTDRKILESHLICKECKGRLPHETKKEWLSSALWVPTYPDRMRQGYYINQLYSMTVKPHEIAIASLEALTSPEDEQEFHNSKLGMPYEVKGARVTEEQIKEALSNYFLKDRSNIQFTTLGVDVGKRIHYVLINWHVRYEGLTINQQTHAQVIDIGEVDEFHELPPAHFTASDAQPEKRQVEAFLETRPGVAVYEENKKRSIMKQADGAYTIDRTTFLDRSLGRFRRNTISLPADTPLDFKDHIKASVKIYRKDKDGNPVARYIAKDPDHYAHALLFAEVALTVGMSVSENTDIEDVL